jgi:predicted nucleic acid-binding protein
VADANVLIAALMRDSTTRRLLVLGGHEIHVPDFVFEEIEGHWDELSSRTGLTPDAFREVLGVMRAHLAEHHVDEYAHYLDAAIRLLANRDVKDAPYVALALALRTDGLWTQDRGLVSMEGVPVVRTVNLVGAAP